jgi:sigma-E factor negative regulatory protein RseC
MSVRLIEHRGVVQRVADGLAIVAMETAGCASCGQSSACGIGKIASGRPATLLTVPVSADIKAGDFVLVRLPESKLTLSALIGYLFPAFAMLLGACLGSNIAIASDAATAVGAIAGFVIALVLARIAIALVPGLMPAPQLIPVSSPASTFRQE